MNRKLIGWLLTLSASLLGLTVGTCAQSSVDGIVQSFKPCDVFNCTSSNFFDPCKFVECGRPTRTSVFDSTNSSSSGSSTSSSSSTSSTSSSSAASSALQGLTF